MKCVLLDTNIYVSAILFGGKPKEIINLSRKHKIELIISEYILWELREVLKNKFGVPDSRLNLIERDIISIAKIIPIKSKVDIIKAHPADNSILACAIDGRADIIVTGDKHLLSIKTMRDPLVLTPSGFLAELHH